MSALARTLEEAASEASSCMRCRLSAGRTQVVYGVGNPHAELMFIGEGPGFHEDKQGEPFVGAAGQVLNKMLHLIGIERADIYIGNIVKCRPPKNRDPLPDEITSCTPYLSEQIDLIDPRVIVTLGNFSTRFILNNQTPISRVRGQRFDWQGRIVIPTFHPAAILHSGGEKSQQYQDLRADFEVIKRVLGEPRTGAGDGPTVFASVTSAPPPPMNGPLVVDEPQAVTVQSAEAVGAETDGPSDDQMGLF